MKERIQIYRNAWFCIMLFVLSLISIGQSKYDGYIIGADKHQNRIYIMDPSKKNLNNGVVWSLSPEELTGVDPGEVPEVGGAEVKRVMGGTHILLIAKRVILVRIADKRVIWHGRIGGGEAHSAELLPDGNIVVAAPKTPALKFFDTSMPNNSLPVNEYKFKNAHGVVWDAKRQVLWATGSNLLNGFYYNFDKHNPNISGIFQENTIEPNGHDLYPVPGEDKLLYTGKDMWVFDIKTQTHEKIGDKGPKSMTQKEPNGEIIYTTGAGTGNPYGISKFQTPEIKSLSGPTRTFTGAGFYKVRWFVPCPFSYPEYDGVVTNTLNQTNEKEEMTIFPNPTQDKNINITLPKVLNKYTLIIMATDGVSVKIEEGFSNESSINVDVVDLATGIYIVTIKTKNGFYKERLIVQ
ncbi:MAG: T9SS type A sorting domain-containing protein [Cytophagales bacterium]|nr:T9SS type A sorting domain-containing protein [Cytophagales bacterium]